MRAAAELFEVLQKHGLGLVSLEGPVASVSAERTSRRGRRFAGMSDQQRADLAVWSKAGRIYGLIEVKPAEQERDWLCDLEKLARLVVTYGRRHGNHLRCGLLGAYIAHPNASGAQLRKVRLEMLAGQVAKRFGLRQRTLLNPALHFLRGGDADDWTCGAATVELRF